jgi:hypothetical protein
MLGKCFTFSRLHEIDATVSWVIGSRVQEIKYLSFDG